MPRTMIAFNLIQNVQARTKARFIETEYSAMLPTRKDKTGAEATL